MNPDDELAARLDRIERAYLRAESAQSWTTRLTRMGAGLFVVALVVFGVSSFAYFLLVATMLGAVARIVMTSAQGVRASQARELLHFEIGHDMHWGCEHDPRPDGSDLHVCARSDETGAWTDVWTTRGENHYRIREMA